MSGRNANLPEIVSPFDIGTVRMIDVRTIGLGEQIHFKRAATKASIDMVDGEGLPREMICQPREQLERHGYTRKLMDAQDAALAAGAQIFDDAEFMRSFRYPIEDWEADPDLAQVVFAVRDRDLKERLGMVQLYNVHADRRNPTILLRCMYGPISAPIRDDKVEGDEVLGRWRTHARIMTWLMKNDLDLEGRPARVVRWNFPQQNYLYRWPVGRPAIKAALETVADVVVNEETKPPSLVSATLPTKAESRL